MGIEFSEVRCCMGSVKACWSLQAVLLQG